MNLNPLHQTPEQIASKNNERNLQAVHQKLDQVHQTTQELDRTTGEGLAHTIQTLQKIASKEVPKEMAVTLKGVSVVSIKGDQGEQGIQGIPGIQGPKGETGESGINGESITGEKGETGPQGVRGRQGEKGDQGIQGKPGTDGTEGKKGKDGSPDTGEQIIRKVNQSKEKIEKERIEGLDDEFESVRSALSGFSIETGLSPVKAGSNITITRDGNGAQVISAAAGSGITRSVLSISADTTAGATASTDYDYYVSGATTLTLPTAVGNTNQYTVTRTGSSNVTIATTSAQTIAGLAGGPATSVVLTVQYAALIIKSDNANWLIS